VPVSIYRAEDPNGLAVSSITPNSSRQLDIDRFVYGMGSYHWRSEPVDLGENQAVTIELGALNIDAPDDSDGRFGLLDSQTGRLVAPVEVTSSICAPDGKYLMRRDLSEETHTVEIRAGNVTTFEMGAIRFSGASLPFGVNILVAEQHSKKITAVVSSLERPVAVAPGQYVLVATHKLRPYGLTVTEKVLVDVKVYQVEWADTQQDGPLLSLHNENTDFKYNPLTNRSNLVFFNTGSLIVQENQSDRGKIELNPDSPVILWRLSDGRIPLFDGLPLSLAEGAPPVIARSSTITLVTETARPAQLKVTLQQGSKSFDLGIHRLKRGVVLLSLSVPHDLADDTPVFFKITDPAEMNMEGRTESLKVHQTLSAGVSDLESSKITETSIALNWQNPDLADLSGVNIYRGEDTRAINGVNPVVGAAYVDHGLSAARQYHYRVCTVDELHYLGPCQSVTARTLKH
jgi:hypothetical protein